MVELPLSAALDAFDAMISAITIDATDPIIPAPIELDTIPDSAIASGDAMVGAAIGAGWCY